MINFKCKVKHLKTLALLFLTERVKNLANYLTTELQTFTLDIKCILMSRTVDIYFLLQFSKGRATVLQSTLWEPIFSLNKTTTLINFCKSTEVKKETNHLKLFPI